MVTDVVDLREHFEATVGTPNRSLLAGFSLGSFSTAIRAERGGFDGTCRCAACSRALRAPGTARAHLLAYQTAFGSLPASWGTPADGDDDIDAETEVFPTLIGNLGSPGGFGKFEFARIVAGVPLSPSYYPNGLFTNMFFQTEARAELERRAGGPVTQNLDHPYWISPGDRLYLGAVGVRSAQSRHVARDDEHDVLLGAERVAELRRAQRHVHREDQAAGAHHAHGHRHARAREPRGRVRRDRGGGGPERVAPPAVHERHEAPRVLVPGFMPASYTPPAWPQP